MTLITTLDDDRLCIKKNPFYPVNGLGIRQAYGDVMMLRDSLRVALSRAEGLGARLAAHDDYIKELEAAKEAAEGENARLRSEGVELAHDLRAKLDVAEAEVARMREAVEAVKIAVNNSDWMAVIAALKEG